MRALLALALLSCAPPPDAPGGLDSAGDGGTPGTADGGGTDPGDGGESGTDGGSTTADGGGEPTPRPALFLNELMPANLSTVQDESGDFPDWIELFNAGEQAVDLAGYTLSDDLDRPDRHVLGELRIEAGGFLLLYADGEVEYGPQHLPFSLSADGEELGLYDPTGAPVDLVRFGAQLPDVSAARAWDGGATWTMGWPATPGDSNGVGTPSTDPAATVEEIPAAAWDDGALFSDEVLPDFGIELSKESLAALQAAPYDYAEGALVYDGRRYEPVGIRTKGENSWQPITAKPSLKVKLDAYDDGPRHLLGHTELTLQNMDNDPSMMHERLAYLVYREAGVPAARATHATVTLNGAPLGLYTHVETVGAGLLARWFEDTGGSLFEQWDVDFTDAYVDGFELEHGPDDRSHIQGLADAMELPDPTAAVAAGAAHLSWESFQRYWAVGAVVGQFDAYPYSSPGDDCHVYADPTSDVLHYLPHGLDETFSSSTGAVETGAGGLLAATCRQDPGCRAAWLAEVEAALDVADRVDLLGRAQAVQEQIAPLVAADARRPYDDAEVAAAQDAMLAFIGGRRAELARQLGTSP